MTWTEIEPPGSFLNCLLNENIVIRVTIPDNNRFTIFGDGQRFVVNGERHEIIAKELPGGKCPGVEYRLRGFATNQITGFNDKDCGNLLSLVNANGFFTGPITDFEQFERTFFNNDGSIQSIDYYIRVRFNGGASFFEGRSQWNFTFSEMNPECYGQFGIDPQEVEEGNLYRFPVPISRSDGDTVTYQGWERVDGTSREEDEEQCPSESEFEAIVYDCNDKILFRHTFVQRPIVTIERDVYQEPIVIKQELYRVMAVTILFFIEDTPEGDIQCVEITLNAPLIILPVPDEIPSDDFDNIMVPLGTFRSPVCEERPPKVEIQCDCFDACPPGTYCVVQEGNTVCCYDINGIAIDSFDVGCVEPDIVC